MLVRLISIVVAALLLALPAHAGQDHRSWSPKKASVMAGAKSVAYSDHRRFGSEQKKFRHSDRGGGSKWHVQRGHKKRHDVTKRHRPNSRFTRSYKKLQRFVKRQGTKWRSHRFKKLLLATYREGPGRHLKPGKRDHKQATKKHRKRKSSYATGKKHDKRKRVSNSHRKHQKVAKKNRKYKNSRAIDKNRGLFAKKAHKYQPKHKKTRRMAHLGGNKRYTPKHGKHKFIGRHGMPKCPPSPSKGHFGSGYGKGKGYGSASCQGHRYWAGKKYSHKGRRASRHGRRDWRSQRYVHMWRAVNRYARS